MEFHVIELPKLPTELKEDSPELLLWAKFINAEKKEEFEMLAEKSPYIESAYEQLQIISQDKQKRMEYEAREKAVRDYNQMMYEAKEAGMEIGIKEGIKVGEQKAVASAVHNMKKLDLPLDIICQVTGLSKEEVENIIKE